VVPNFSPEKGKFSANIKFWNRKRFSGFFSSEAIIIGQNNKLIGNTFSNMGGILITKTGFALGFRGNLPTFSEVE
jgi:hypothetical protein